jgi:hypothetical protein
MKVHSQIDTKMGLDGEIHITNCEPQQLRVVTERLINMIYEMVNRLDYQFPSYHTMTELDKILMVNYWQTYDGLPNEVWLEWFIKHATEPELIRRARQWLVSHNYIKINDDVKDRAEQAGHNFRQAVKGKCTINL